MTCKCTPCDECKGSRNVWVAFDGEYLGTSRCDDMDEMETCGECSGTGISEMCEECREIEERERWEEEEGDSMTGLNGGYKVLFVHKNYPFVVLENGIDTISIDKLDDNCSQLLGKRYFHWFKDWDVILSDNQEIMLNSCIYRG